MVGEKCDCVVTLWGGGLLFYDVNNTFFNISNKGRETNKNIYVVALAIENDSGGVG